MLTQLILQLLHLFELSRTHFCPLCHLFAFLENQFLEGGNFPAQELEKCDVQSAVPFQEEILHHFLDNAFAFLLQHFLENSYKSVADDTVGVLELEQHRLIDFQKLYQVSFIHVGLPIEHQGDELAHALGLPEEYIGGEGVEEGVQIVGLLSIESDELEDSALESSHFGLGWLGIRRLHDGVSVLALIREIYLVTRC